MEFNRETASHRVVRDALINLRDRGVIGFIDGVTPWTIRNIETEGWIRFSGDGYKLTPAGERRIEELANV